MVPSAIDSPICGISTGLVIVGIIALTKVEGSKGPKV
jgi:hypothetical protein